MSEAYKAAIKKNDEAIHVYHSKRDEFRAKLISVDEFLEAQKAYKLAMNEFDAAYVEESK